MIEEIKEPDNWNRLCNAIKLTIDILRDRFNISDKKLLSSNNALIPIIYWNYKNSIRGVGSETNCLSETNLIKMRTWLIKALLSGVFGGQSDTILIKCKEAIDSVQTQDFPSGEIEIKIKNETKKDMQVDSEYLDKAKYNNKNSFLVLSLIYKGAINFQPSLRANIPEQDHIFSQSELKSYGYSKDEIDSIYNIRYIGKAPNQTKSNKNFSDWITTQSEQDLNTHLIPQGNWNIENYKSFISSRRELVISKFNY